MHAGSKLRGIYVLVMALFYSSTTARNVHLTDSFPKEPRGPLPTMIQQNRPPPRDYGDDANNPLGVVTAASRGDRTNDKESFLSDELKQVATNAGEKQDSPLSEDTNSSQRTASSSVTASFTRRKRRRSDFGKSHKVVKTQRKPRSDRGKTHRKPGLQSVSLTDMMAIPPILPSTPLSPIDLAKTTAIVSVKGSLMHMPTLTPEQSRMLPGFELGKSSSSGAGEGKDTEGRAQDCDADLELASSAASTFYPSPDFSRILFRLRIEYVENAVRKLEELSALGYMNVRVRCVAKADILNPEGSAMLPEFDAIEALQRMYPDAMMMITNYNNLSPPRTLSCVMGSSVRLASSINVRFKCTPYWSPHHFDYTNPCAALGKKYLAFMQREDWDIVKESVSNIYVDKITTLMIVPARRKPDLFITLDKYMSRKQQMCCFIVAENWKQCWIAS
eukprot:jgi/Bigna1/70708/fgenesh1_pg.13_\